MVKLLLSQKKEGEEGEEKGKNSKMKSAYMNLQVKLRYLWRVNGCSINFVCGKIKGRS